MELLISSNVARYVEFKCVTRVLTWVEGSGEAPGRLLDVPCSRSDVFTTDVIDLVEKRLLMKFLEFCHTYEQNRDQWAGEFLFLLQALYEPSSSSSSFRPRGTLGQLRVPSVEGDSPVSRKRGVMTCL